MPMHIIGSDIDGIAADIDRAMLEEAKRLEMVPQDATYDCSCGRIEDHFGWTEDEFHRILTPRMFRQAEPIMPVVASLRRWMDRGEKVLFLTARNEECQDATMEWLHQLGLLPSLGCLFSRSSKKVHVAEQWGVTIFIDDYHRVIEPMVGVIPHPFLIASPWNVNVDYGMKVWPWVEAEAEIERLLSEDHLVEAVGDGV